MLTIDLSTAKRVQPCFIEPMYAELCRELPDGDAWTSGGEVRRLPLPGGQAERGRCALVALRHGFTGRFPEIARACDRLPPDTMIDDVLIHRGRKVTGLPLEERRAFLTELMRKIEYAVIQSTPFDVRPVDLIKAAKELELEGVIAKRKGSIYEPGRKSRVWLKYKINRSQEFVIGGYTVGNPFDALIVGCYEGTKLIYASKIRAGFNPSLRRELYRLFQSLQTGRCPFENLPEDRRYRWGYGLTKEEMQNCRWLRRLLVAQIEFNGRTLDGHLRHASFGGLREDKDGGTL